ncbi:hypothetical protein [Rugamonas sp.]|uniref:hypothetical protein n=1 Tax=Rugamonas sp. TaxID=1926287 RepID=UPI0025D31E44|nr:hypothetical protein [Rugamonas sp.]
MYTTYKQGRPSAAARQHRDAHVRLAKVQSSLHATRVAIARWLAGHGGTEAADAPLPSPSPQQRWHTDTQRGFCAWLDAGGFSQATPEADDHSGAIQLELNCLHCD